MYVVLNNVRCIRVVIYIIMCIVIICTIFETYYWMVGLHSNLAVRDKPSMAFLAFLIIKI